MALKRYPPHLWTLEFQLPPTLPVLFHHYPSEAEARAGFLAARSVMSTSNGSILALHLYHRHQLLASAIPTPAVVRVLPPPDADGIRRLPAVSRALRPSSQYFNSAEVMARGVVTSDDELRI